MKSGERVDQRRRPLSLLALVSVAVVVLCVFVMRHTIVAFDDWNFVLDRRGARPSLIPGTADQWLQPHNGHPVMILVGIYRIVGSLANYSYQVLVGIAALVHVALAGALYVYARRRLGAWAALVPAMLVALLGRGAPIVLSPIVMAFTLALVAGITALNLVDRWAGADPECEPTLVRALTLTFLGLFAVMSSGLGVARVVTNGMDRVLRARHWTTLVRWVFIAGFPLAAVAIWYVNVRDEARSTAALGGSISFGLRVFANGVAGLVGLGSRWSTPVGLLFTGALVAIVAWRWGFVDRYRLGALIVGIVIDVGLVSWARAGTSLPASGRYVYVFGVQAALVMTEALAGWRIPLAHRRIATAVAVVATIAAVIGGAGAFQTIADDFRTDNHRTQVSLYAFLSAQRNGVKFSPYYQPDPELAPQVSVARLNGLLADGKSPIGGSVPRPRTETERAIADYFDAATILSVEPMPPSPADQSPFNFSGEVPIVADESNVRMQTRGPCTSIVPTGGAAFVDVVAPLLGTTWHISPGEGAQGTFAVRARQRGPGYASRTVVSVSTAPNKASASVKAVFADRSTIVNARPWVLRIEPTMAIKLCSFD